MLHTLSRFYRYIFRYWPSFVVGLVLFTISSTLANLTPFFIRWITSAVQQAQFAQATQMLVWFAIALLVENIIANIAYFISDKGMVHTSTDIAKDVLAHIHNLDFAYHVNKSSGALISLMKRGDDAYYSYFDILHRAFLETIVSIILMSSSFFVLRPSYALVVGVFVALCIGFSLLLIRVNLAKRKLFNDADDDVSSARVDNLVNFDTVKYFAQEEFEQHRFSTLLQRWYDTLQGYFFTFRYFDGIIGNLTSAAIIVLLFLGIRDLSAGKITLGDLLFLSSFAATMFPRMMHVLFQMRELAKKYDDLSRYLALLDEPIAVKDPIQALEPTTHSGTIRFDHVTFAYHKDSAPVLEDFSLTLKPGEVVAFVGYSGAGKTTITKLLMRMYDPLSGAILVDDIAISDMKKSTLRSLIGIVPQDPLLFNNTVTYNIAYAKPGCTTEEVHEAARKAQADAFIHVLQKGYDTIVGERGIKLSGGQRQRLAIARVLLKQPQIVIFDEATAALDSESEQAIQKAFWDMVRDPQKPKTSIVIAHRLSTVMRADRIVVLHEGHIAETGTHTQLIGKKDGIYAHLWQLQKDGFLGDEEEE